MRFRLPSFRTQIILLVMLLIVTSVLFFRDFFINSFQSFSETSETLSTNEKSRRLYLDYNFQLDEVNREQFRKDIEEIMSTENQKIIARRVFINEIELYSKFIFFFLTVSVIILFLISFYFITRPLKRLQDATLQLAQGNLSVQIKESKFSPLNDLIISFNTMSQELESNKKKIIQAEKDAAWRDMARILAHEIKNPLTPIRLSLERLEMKYASKSKDLDKVFSNVTKVIHEEINNLQTFATEFSKFAKLPEAVMKHYNVNKQLAEICTPYQTELKIDLKLEEKLPLIFADKIQVKQVLENLIQNSINAAKDNFIITINTNSTDSVINISIQDNGYGINAEDINEIFKPYFTKSRGGTGLGLAIVKRIIESHGGSINVESQVDVGTTFNLSFPIVHKQEQ
ncbi:MAG: HAMP domain-containing protein [Planctomycetia bacterium]|nr:HAMP domain-containing protein [Planctomycetia bacterium]